MTPTIAAMVWACSMVLWVGLRAPYAYQARRAKSVGKRAGWGDFLLLAGAGVGLFFVPALYLSTDALRFADAAFHPPAAWFGCAAMVLFLLVFYLSHRHLGRNFSMSLEIRERHELVADGLYRYVRHPMYASFWLWAIGQALLFANWFVGVAGLAAIAALYFGRIAREERMMEDAFGEAYAAYRDRTSRLIPWIY